MMTREEVLSIEEYCADHKVSHKDLMGHVSTPYVQKQTYAQPHGVPRSSRHSSGIPCIVKENGEVIISLKRYDEALATERATTEYAPGAACNLDGSGC